MSYAIPNFLVIGAMKCATSTVCAYLEDHPDVYCLPSCEPNFFSHDQNYEKGTEWYLNLFKDRGDEHLFGEGSNFYSARALYPYTAERVAALNPNMKIIFTARDPIERIISAWIQRRSDSGDAVPPSVDAAVLAMPDEFIGQSQYYYNIQPYIERFPRENIFIGFMEDLKRDGSKFFAELCEFLEVDAIPGKRGHVNPSAGKRVPNELFTKVNGFPMAQAVKGVMPQGLKRAVKRMMEKDVSSSDISLSPSVLADVLKTISRDAELFLEYAGKPQDFWWMAKDR